MQKIGRGYKRATDEEVAAAYLETGSVWKAAKKVGLVGQTVHERLRRLGIEPAHAKWTAEEDQELESLMSDIHLTISDIAKRLNRTSASISCRANELGIKKAQVPKHKRIPRGSGYDKRSIQKHLKSVDGFDGSLTKYCRSNGLQIENFARAVQKYFPEWWNQYVEYHSGLEKVACAYCEEEFFPNNARQRFCSRKCSNDFRRDRDYFSGNRKKGKGVINRECQICLHEIDLNAKVHVHHIYGKGRDPDNEHLIALCSRCHMALEQLAQHKHFVGNGPWIRMMKFVWLKTQGWKEEFEGSELGVFLVREVKSGEPDNDRSSIEEMH